MLGSVNNIIQFHDHSQHCLMVVRVITVKVVIEQYFNSFAPISRSLSLSHTKANAMYKYPLIDVNIQIEKKINDKY